MTLTIDSMCGKTFEYEGDTCPHDYKDFRWCSGNPDSADDDIRITLVMDRQTNQPTSAYCVCESADVNDFPRLSLATAYSLIGHAELDKAFGSESTALYPNAESFASLPPEVTPTEDGQ